MPPGQGSKQLATRPVQPGQATRPRQQAARPPGHSSQARPPSSPGLQTSPPGQAWPPRQASQGLKSKNFLCAPSAHCKVFLVVWCKQGPRATTGSSQCLTGLASGLPLKVTTWMKGETQCSVGGFTRSCRFHTLPLGCLKRTGFSSCFKSRATLLLDSLRPPSTVGVLGCIGQGWPRI